MSLVGASLLWVGWFGFNAGSAVAANGRAGMAMTVTMVATAVAGLAWMFTEWKMRGKPSVAGLISGAVAGLVAITLRLRAMSTRKVPCGSALPLVSFATLAGAKLKPVFGYDDSLDCFGVHGVGGFIGALLTGVFAKSAISGSDTMKGWIDGNADQVIIQLEGIGCTIGWCALMTFIIAIVLEKTIGLRVSAADEKIGLDLSQHGEALEE